MAGQELMSIVEATINLTVLLVRIQLLVASQLVYRFTGIRIGLGHNHEDDADFTNHTDNAIYNRIIDATDINEIADVHGYIIREHVVNTTDDYLLVIHKLEKKVVVDDKEGDEHVNKKNRRVAYFHHGLLTNSELFVLGTKKEKNLPFLLVDLGYDVWLGNNRGNKYSRKHLKYSVCDQHFWNFSLDEYALYDIPDTIDYITSLYDANTQLTYVGFSQGCSQLFASLSLRPDLNNKLNLFVALSPAVIPNNLKHPVLKLIVQQSARDNNFLTSLFGDRALVSSVTFWSYIMGSRLYERVVDTSLTYLFGWSGKNIGPLQKRIGYPHMFSNSSVKSLTHWFQIINARRFQMFDETCKFGMTSLAVMSDQSKSKAHRVAPFPVAHHLDVPILLAYGDADILVDIENTKRLIMDQNAKMRDKLIDAIKCEGYEHMDTLWGNNVYQDVFRKVIATMEAMHKTNQHKIDRLSINKYDNGSRASLVSDNSNVDSLYS